MNKFLINQLNFKYNYNSFMFNKSLQIGSLININTIKGKFKGNFFGILIKKKNISGSVSVTLRNVVKRYAVEKTFNLCSNIVLNVYLVRNRLNKFNSRYNLFYLRTISKIHSTIK